MRATHLSAALVVGLSAACARSGPEAATATEMPAPTAPCSAYAHDASVHAYCLTQKVAALRDVSEMLTLCATTGAYEADCRARWVEAWSVPGSGASDHAVISACLDDDCRFTAIDRRPVADADAQVERCKTAGRYGEDCARHAYQRWVAAQPDETEIARMASGTGPYPEIAAAYAGQAVGCWHRGSCDGARKNDCLSGVALAARDAIACKDPRFGGVLVPM